jgi:glycosyltransferase involved in cell wall biosynthesis
MRVAMISEHASPLAALGGVDAGGQNTHVAALAEAIGEMGHEVAVYTRRDANHQPEVVELAPRVTVVHVPAGPPAPISKDRLLPYMPAFGDWLARRWDADTWTPEVIHAHFWMSGVAAHVANRRAGLPVVQTYHALGAVKRRYQGAADTSPSQRIAIERWLGQRAARVVAQCRDERRELRAIGVPDEKVGIAPSGVDLDRFTPIGPAVPRPDSDRVRILSVGRLVPRKGHEHLIRAMRSVPAAELVIVGGQPHAGPTGDPDLARLAAYSSSCGVADRVHLVGPVAASEMASWYRSADVVACAPWYEPFGLVPLEAMACGIPVVGYAVGGLLDTVRPGITGDLVPGQDVAALAAALARLAADSARRRRYGNAGAAVARREYSWARTADRVGEIYHQVVRPSIGVST